MTGAEALPTSWSKTELLEVFQSAYAELRYYLESKLSNKQDAEDVLQDLFVKLSSMDDNADLNLKEPKHYLFRSASNMAINLQRRRNMIEKYDSEGFKSVENKTDAPPPESALESQQMADLLHQALASMPPKRRQIMLLLRFRGLTRAEIAKELDMSISAVEKHIVRGMMYCRDYIKKEAEQ